MRTILKLLGGIQSNYWEDISSPGFGTTEYIDSLLPRPEQFIYRLYTQVSYLRLFCPDDVEI